MKNKEQKRRAEEEARRTMDLLDKQARQEADPWLAERTLARLHRKPQAMPDRARVPSWQWALTTLLLLLNSTALYIGLNADAGVEPSELSQALDNEYELGPSGDLYDFTSNSYDNDNSQSY